MNTSKLKKKIDPRLDRSQAKEWSTWFDALSDPTRVLILNLLATQDEPLTVGQITEQLDVGQSTVSHHLAKLADVRFVIVQRSGTSSHWAINKACIEGFPSAVDVIMGRASR